jgi:hypothetical protein
VIRVRSEPLPAGDNIIGHVGYASIRETPVKPSVRSATGTSGMLSGEYGAYSDIIAQLNVTAKSGTNPTLDVKIQHSVDNGKNWEDLIDWTQVVSGTSLPSNEYVTVSRWHPTTPLYFGNKLQIVWTIGGTDTPTWAFSVDWMLRA